MPTTAHKLCGRHAGAVVLALLLFPVLLCQAADDSPLPGITQVIAQLASALSQGDSVTALETFDSKVPSYNKTETAIAALTAQAEILCSIDIVDEKTSGDNVTLDVDWFMTLKPLTGSGNSERRRERVTLQLHQVRGKWRITSVLPIVILAPITIV